MLMTRSDAVADFFFAVTAADFVSTFQPQSTFLRFLSSDYSSHTLDLMVVGSENS